MTSIVKVDMIASLVQQKPRNKFIYLTEEMKKLGCKFLPVKKLGHPVL